MRPTLPSRRRVLGWVALGIGLIGCGEELPPERFATTTVRGVIQVGGRPVPGGFIEILPTGRAATFGPAQSPPMGPFSSTESRSARSS